MTSKTPSSGAAPASGTPCIQDIKKTTSKYSPIYSPYSRELHLHTRCRHDQWGHNSYKSRVSSHTVHDTFFFSLRVIGTKRTKGFFRSMNTLARRYLAGLILPSWAIIVNGASPLSLQPSQLVLFTSSALLEHHLILAHTGILSNRYCSTLVNPSYSSRMIRCPSKHSGTSFRDTIPIPQILTLH